MIILTSTRFGSCTDCRGWGIVDDKAKRVQCPSCNSIHPDSLGLKYKVERKKTVRFYVVNVPKWVEKLLRFLTNTPK